MNFPLSTQRRPQVSCDGKRLIVLGQDHIGLIILVYRVINAYEDQPLKDECSSSSFAGQCNEKLGGVINLENGGCQSRIQYVSRIRHVGLRGLDRDC